ncbi:EamA family transporter [Spongiimicrobium sp. 2-473A-2-J]|uniref:EamA family transporter n=1 Tax=Eudoraea algarum TaxID=3417568 RepID=UPI003D36A34D
MKVFRQNSAFNWKLIFAFLGIYLGWGTTYLAIALALRDFPPFLLAGIRFFLAGSLLLIWCRWKGEPFPEAKELLPICLAGILLLFFGSGSVIWVEQYLSTGLTAIIWASLPIWLVLLDRKKWSLHFSNPKLLTGLMIGFSGVLFLFKDQELLQTNKDVPVIAFVIALGGVVLFSMGSLYTKYMTIKASTKMTAGIQLFVVGLLALFSGFLMGEPQLVKWQEISASALFGLLYLILIGSIFAYLAYVWLIGIMPTTLVGTYTYVNPAVAILLGWYVLGENISLQRLLGLGIIFLGVLLINLYKSKSNYYDNKNMARNNRGKTC